MTKKHSILIKFLLVFTMVISTVTFAQPTIAYAKSYPAHTLSVKSSNTKITKKQVTAKVGKKIKLDKIKYGTRVGDASIKKYKYAKVNPTKVKWVSSNKNVATVNKQGIVTAKKAGKTVIKGTYKKLSYKITVTVCKHSWKKVYKTVHHDAVTHVETKPGGTEKIWHEGKQIGVQYICSCGACFTDIDVLTNHQVEQSLASESGHQGTSSMPLYSDGYYETVTLPAKKITVVDKKAYDEKVLTGYKCKKCGQTKSK